MKPILRYLALALPAGTLIGAAAAGDIRTSYREGRVAAPAIVAPAAAEPIPVMSRDEQELAATYGQAIAAQLGYTDPADCRTVPPELRSGCRDHVERRRSGRLGEQADPLL